MYYYGYRGRYRSWRSRSYSPSSKYSRLVELFGGAVDDIKREFFAFNEDAIYELFEDYGSIHGDSAKRYAKKTFPNWKSGITKLSGQTMERLIELVPPYLSPEQRFSLLQQVVKQNLPSKPSKGIRINVKEPSAGFAELDSAISSMQHVGLLAHVPERVMQAASWLYDDDITAARAMLAEAERVENDLILKSAEREIQILKRTILSGQVKAASYSVEMPAGNLSVIAYEPSKCFVATICFGNESNEVSILRNWRDSSLIHDKNGRLFIIWYYNHGEKISRIIGSHSALKIFSQYTIKLLVHWIINSRKTTQDDNHD